MSLPLTTDDAYRVPPAGLAPRAVYVHVPFCIHRCGYCDFTLVADRQDLVPAYLQAIEAELRQVPDPLEVDTIFIGGGTPSLLTAEQLSRLVRCVLDRFPLSESGEFSVEANPDGLTEGKMSALADLGVNRLSLGAQSFEASVLETLEREHSPEEARGVVEAATKIFSSVSLDLIFGVPGQSLMSWQESLDTAAEMPVRHVSTYGLTFEKGTEFYRRQLAGQLSAVPDTLEREMYATAMKTLSAAGFRHYEISNFARSGGECRHNRVYWAAEEYFAFGPGAARYVNGVRSTNARSVMRWLKSWQQEKPALQEIERLDPSARIREAIFLGLRLTGGIDLVRFQERFGTDPRDVNREAYDANLEHGLLECCDGCMRLTAEGRFLADSVVTDFL